MIPITSVGQFSFLFYFTIFSHLQFTVGKFENFTAREFENFDVQAVFPCFDFS